ncbi:MAG: MBL fold metallo-hydrolase [Acidobacteriota bacterium]|nr:MBL fold metallo-hydrolase [Acidobacteriota bacterium]
MNIPPAGSGPARAALLLLFFTLNTFAAPADSVNTRERTATQVAEGVYVIRHKDAPDGFPQGNTTVIVGGREVFVVDSCYLPSSAREDIEQIRRWTDKPVRYLLNTHWHYDHTMGNGVYAEAFPALAIVAHAETRRQSEGYNPGWFERYPGRAAQFKQLLESGKDSAGRALTDIEKRDYAAALAGVAPVEAEFKALADRLPNLTFEQGLTVDLGGREVQVRHFGRGNTAGDAVVYLPKEKILIAGDLVTHPVPYLGGGFPSEMVATLQRLAQLDADAVVPGHGEVLRGKTYLNQTIEFVQAVVAQVSREVYRLGNSSRRLEDVQKAVPQAVDVAAWRRRFAGDDPDNRDFFDTFSLPGLITAAYAEAWRR